MKKKLIELTNARAALLTQAEDALKHDKVEDYDSAMQKIANANTEIERVQNLLREQERRADAVIPSAAEARDMAEERANTLRNGGEIKFSADEVRRGIRNSVTVATSTLAMPTGAGVNIHDGLGLGPSSVVDQVFVQDMTGLTGWQEPFVISEPTAGADDIASLAGTTRSATSDPTFGVAEIKPYEINVTNYVDRNIARLTPTGYYEKIYGMAMRAMRRKLAALILNGDSETTHVFHGFKTATSKAGAAIYAAENVTALDVNTLDTLYFGYGGSSEIGSNTRLFANKTDLKALGMLRGTNEKSRLFRIVHDAQNANIGMIEDGGLAIPYTICSDLTALSTATQTTSAIQTMVYADPMNYMLGLFGDFTVRVDDSVKSVERLITILGDAFVGGNLVVYHGASIATLPATSG